eukprot:9152527-Heterocapsa_arctica.AAC.1
MASAIVNGPRQNSKIAEFRRKIKDCLTHRHKWDKESVDHKTTYAEGGCARWTPGEHFASWQYDTAGHYEPDKDGYIAERFR